MRVAVCETDPELEPGSKEWKLLAGRVRAVRPDLFLLNELPFGPWVAAGEHPDPKEIMRSQRLHQEGIAHLQELLFNFGATNRHEQSRRSDGLAGFLPRMDTNICIEFVALLPENAAPWLPDLDRTYNYTRNLRVGHFSSERR